MRFRLICFTSIGLLCGASLTTLAYEAPVVSASQQEAEDAGMNAQSDTSNSESDTSNTQAEASNNGSWQTMASDADSGWQRVNDNPPPSPANNAPDSNAAPNTPDTNNIPTHSGSMKKRVARLEQQMSNVTQMNLPQQVNDLQQKVSQLQGQLEADQHQLQIMAKQQKMYYQDLTQQMASSSPKGKVTPDNASNTSNANTATPMTNNNQQSQSIANKPAEMTAVSSDPNSPPSLGDADAYGKAFRLLSNKNFNQASSAFQNYLQQYPSGQFCVNAHFWLGEIAMMNQHFDSALHQFKTVVTTYPKSDKVPDATLKIAMIHAAMGKTNMASKEFVAIRKEYPGTTAAQLANIRLQQLANATSVNME